MDLFDYLKSARKSLFRFEALQEFDVPEEKVAVKEYNEIGRVDFASMKEWFEFIEKKNSEGVWTGRVRLVKLPVNDYTKMELACHRETAKHGDKIEVIVEKEFDKLGVSEKDFWLIDDERVLLMNYDLGWKYLGFDVLEEGVRKYVEWKKLLIENSVPVEGFDFN